MTDKSGPAFPGEGFEPGAGKVHFRGMTLRDYFAGQALAGICASGQAMPAADELTARTAYQIADAMLTERAS